MTRGFRGEPWLASPAARSAQIGDLSATSNAAGEARMPRSRGSAAPGARAANPP